MLNFAAKHFRTFFGISLWLNLISCVIFGGSTGYKFDGGLAAFIGVILGIVVGLLINIIFGGLIAVFLNIDKGVKNINKWLQCIWQYRINTDANQKIRLSPIDDDAIYYFDYLEESPKTVSKSSNSLTDSLLS
jgi:hypothetical protein